MLAGFGQTLCLRGLPDVGSILAKTLILSSITIGCSDVTMGGAGGKFLS